MKKKLTAVGLGLAAVGLLAFGSPDAHADACNTSTNGHPTGGDTITTSPADGAVIYGAQDSGAAVAGGYIGISGPHGYLDISGSDGNATIQGDQTDSGVNGKATTAPSVCVNGTTAP